MSDERCPVMYSQSNGARPGPTTISMSIAERWHVAYEQRYGRGTQSLARIIQRGGIHAGELDSMLPGEDWRAEESELHVLRTANAKLTAERDEARAALAESEAMRAELASAGMETLNRATAAERALADMTARCEARMSPETLDVLAEALDAHLDSERIWEGRRDYRIAEAQAAIDDFARWRRAGEEG